jgi:hypothetical protein
MTTEDVKRKLTAILSADVQGYSRLMGDDERATVETITAYRKIRGTAEQWIKESKYALNWTRLSCKHFTANQVRLWLFVLAYNLGNFLRRLALPAKIKRWSLRSLLVKMIKIGAKLVDHGRYLTFQMAEVSNSREIFAEILSRIKQLRCCEV